ncbi:response regulator [Thiospirochaeta perfilievii]|uniref:Response regulator n=1 Tax=Thiospirochaeta perfilievii TaxID=252967 RepID=A0A5C1Q8P7_9SPIO|nr:response regulator [Thiospirochaeta perfilievii]QEN03797.1 response regulator [Thiospirochaeta perfilievii]
MRRVLIVDDIPFIRSVIKDILIAGDFGVVGEASDGAQALAMYKAVKPDVVLLDINMPVLDGIETLKRIKKINKEAIIIMCSSLGDQENIVNAISLGAKDFVVKPFRKERILSALEKAIL